MSEGRVITIIAIMVIMVVCEMGSVDVLINFICMDVGMSVWAVFWVGCMGCVGVGVCWGGG